MLRWRTVGRVKGGVNQEDEVAVAASQPQEKGCTMRKVLSVCALLLAFAALRPVEAKPISVRLREPPPGKAAVEDLWWVDLHNGSRSDTYTIWLHGEASERSHGRVYSANTHPFPMPPGHKRLRLRDIKLKDQWAKPGFEAFVLRTGRLPAGYYTYSVKVMPESLGDGGTGHVTVENPSPPRLTSPPDGGKVTAKTFTFGWTSVGNFSGRVSYELILAEVLPGQSKEEALRSNRPWYQNRNLTATMLQYPLSAEPLETGKSYAWQVRAYLEDERYPSLASEVWGFKRTIQVMKGGYVAVLNPLKVSREVERFGNWFRVKLTLTNIGSSSITNIVLTDSHRYFQCIDDAQKRRVPPPGGEQFPGWTTEWEAAADEVHDAHGGFRGIIEVDLCDWLLPPNQSFTVRYSVLPLLTVSVTGQGHTIGEGLKATYRIGTNQYLREYNTKALYPVPGLADAWKSADYIITSCPSRLYDANPGGTEAVERLLVTMAELAKAKKGALLYFTSAPASAPIVRSAFKAFGTVLKNKWQNGYLLLVGENEIVPCWDTVTPVPSRPIPNCDHQYADLQGDAAPEVKVGRIIGTTAADLTTGIRHSLDAYYHTGGATWSGATALMLTGEEQPSKGDNFTKEAGEGANYLRASKGVLATHWGMEYITTRRSVIEKALKHTKVEDGGAGTGANLSSFSTEQLAAWLLEITVGLPAPHGGDQHFTDTEGRARRVPHGFDDGDIRAASDQAEDIENARRGSWVNQAYGYPASVSESTAIQLRFQLPRFEALFFSAHGGSSGKSFNRLTTDVVNTIDFTSMGTRPAIVSFTCYLGNYAHQSGTISRAFMRRGCAAHIGYSAMTNTGWFRSHVGSPHTFLQFWQKGKKFGDVFFDWKRHLSTDPAADARLVAGYNLYGDPKLGGN